MMMMWDERVDQGEEKQVFCVLFCFCFVFGLLLIFAFLSLFLYSILSVCLFVWRSVMSNAVKL